jgi:CDP-glucose 4,6-dehydratase
MEQWKCSLEGMAVNTDFWRGKKVLVTGHTGFKGSWLSLWLQSLGANLCGIALAPVAKPALFEIARVSDGMHHCLIDIRDFTSLKAQFIHFKPEIIIHMAAQPLVRLSYHQPVETYSTNVMGTVHVLEAARQCESVKAIVNVTTDKCYENREWFWSYRENEPLGGYDPYSSSKSCAELVTAAYRNSFLRDAGIAVATARAGNVIGGGDWSEDRLVPDVFRALLGRKTIVIRNPDSIRPWQHVLEPLYGYLLLGERLFQQGEAFATAWNFGPSDDGAQSVKWVVEHLCKTWGCDANWDLQQGSHPHEAEFLKLDISKARHCLNWTPRWSLDTALSNITDWYRGWMDGKDMRQLCLQQIEDYSIH